MFLFSDGQAIAKRLQKTIKKTNNQIKRLVSLYNEKDVDISLPTSLTFEAVSKGQLFYQEDEHGVGSSSIPTALKKHAVDLHCLLTRGTEEQELLVKEMKNVSSVFQRQHEILCKTISSTDFGSSSVGAGRLSLLISKAVTVELEQIRFYECCKHFVDLPFPKNTFLETIFIEDNGIFANFDDLGLDQVALDDIKQEALCLEEDDENQSDASDDDC